MPYIFNREKQGDFSSGAANRYRWMSEILFVVVEGFVLDTAPQSSPSSSVARTGKQEYSMTVVMQAFYVALQTSMVSYFRWTCDSVYTAIWRKTWEMEVN